MFIHVRARTEWGEPGLFHLYPDPNNWRLAPVVSVRVLEYTVLYSNIGIMVLRLDGKLEHDADV